MRLACWGEACWYAGISVGPFGQPNICPVGHFICPNPIVLIGY